MSSKVLTAILEDDASAVMATVDDAMIEKLALLVESAKSHLAENMLYEQDESEDDEEGLEENWRHKVKALGRTAAEFATPVVGTTAFE